MKVFNLDGKHVGDLFQEFATSYPEEWTFHDLINKFDYIATFKQQEEYILSQHGNFILGTFNDFVAKQGKLVSILH